jgi:MFS family permease
MIFFLAQKGSLLGSTIVMLAIIWYLADLAPIVAPENPNLVISIVSFLSLAPMVILSPIVGVIADHADKKKIIFYADLLQMQFDYPDLEKSP